MTFQTDTENNLMIKKIILPIYAKKLSNYMINYKKYMSLFFDSNSLKIIYPYISIFFEVSVHEYNYGIQLFGNFVGDEVYWNLQNLGTFAKFYEGLKRI